MKKLLTALVLGVALTSGCSAQTIGIDIGSIHLPKHEWQHGFNPGVYYVSEEGLTAGLFLNSIGRVSGLLGVTAEANALAFTVGAVSGYQYKPVGRHTEGSSPGYITFFLQGSYRLPFEVMEMHPRVGVIPGFQGTSTVITFSIERKLN